MFYCLPNARTDVFTISTLCFDSCSESTVVSIVSVNVRALYPYGKVYVKQSRLYKLTVNCELIIYSCLYYKE